MRKPSKMVPREDMESAKQEAVLLHRALSAMVTGDVEWFASINESDASSDAMPGNTYRFGRFTLNGREKYYLQVFECKATGQRPSVRVMAEWDFEAIAARWDGTEYQRILSLARYRERVADLKATA